MSTAVTHRLSPAWEINSQKLIFMKVLRGIVSQSVANRIKPFEEVSNSLLYQRTLRINLGKVRVIVASAKQWTFQRSTNIFYVNNFKLFNQKKVVIFTKAQAGDLEKSTILYVFFVQLAKRQSKNAWHGFMHKSWKFSRATVTSKLDIYLGSGSRLKNQAKTASKIIYIFEFYDQVDYPPIDASSCSTIRLSPNSRRTF
uniref:Uncharacterized protein n=1 Tax=Echinococcus canadensis TaxID=519352 RepID=A0A915EXW8_9CEST